MTRYASASGLAILVTFELATHDIGLSVRGVEGAPLDISEAIPCGWIELETQPVPITIHEELRPVVDHGFEHRQRGGIKRALRASEFADNQLHFRDGLERQILFGEHIHGFTDGSVCHGGGHKEKGSFIQRRHELLAQSRERMGDGSYRSS